LVIYLFIIPKRLGNQQRSLSLWQTNAIVYKIHLYFPSIFNWNFSPQLTIEVFFYQLIGGIRNIDFTRFTSFFGLVSEPVYGQKVVLNVKIRFSFIFF